MMIDTREHCSVAVAQDRNPKFDHSETSHTAGSNKSFQACRHGCLLMRVSMSIGLGGVFPPTSRQCRSTRFLDELISH